MHPFLVATEEEAESWYSTADGRLSPEPQAGILEARVSRSQLGRAVAIADHLIATCEEAGLEVIPLGASRGHRAGIGIGRNGHFTAVRIEERRELVMLSDQELERWLATHAPWRYKEDALRQRRAVPRASGKLRLLLPRRHDQSPDPRGGWQSSFSDQEGRALEQKVPEVVDALVRRTERPLDKRGEA